MEFYGRLKKDEWRLYNLLLTEEGKKCADKFKRKILENRKGFKPYTPEYDTKILFANYESFCEKTFFPFHFTNEEWSEYEEAETIYINCAYDCTGKIFTRRLEKHEVKNGTFVYHFKSVDC